MSPNRKNMKKKMFRLRSQYDADKYVGQVFTRPSLAEPNQSLTAQQILNNFRLTGRTGLSDRMFDEDGILEDAAYMDKLELEDYQRAASSRLQQYQERLQREQEPEPVDPVEPHVGASDQGAEER